MKKSLLLFVGAAFAMTLVTACGDTSSSSSASSVDSNSTSSTPASSDDTSSGPVVGTNGGATGAVSYVASSAADRTEILGKLEKYAMDEHLTGLTLFENGGYVMYNQRIQKATENYITGYGFGILREGSITADLSETAEPNAAYRRYYHTWDAQDPGNINDWDADGSDVDDLASYLKSSYWGTKMNASKDGYDWYPLLAKEKPVAVNASESGLATKWKFKVRTGTDGLTYRTGTSNANLKKYDNRAVTLEDYITPYKILLTQSNKLYRGAEMADTGAGTIKGAKAYYEQSADGFNEEAWKNVGVTADSSDNSITIELNVPCTEFYAMYYLSSTLTSPMPQEFVDEIGGAEKYGCFDSSKGYTPVDTTLACSPYYLTAYQTDKEIVYAKNDEWFESKADTSIYTIPGVHISIITAYNTDNTAAFKEFLDGKIDAASIPLTYLAEYKNDARTTKTTGNSTFKLNMNTCDEDTWVSLFGEDGSITQTQPANYWDLKPCMSNDDFVNGLSASIDRETFATNRGSIPSQNYFASAYMSDPENGISYNTTAAHEEAISDYFPESYGYNLEAAKALFKKACDKFTADGSYTVDADSNGKKEVSIEICWMYENNIKSYGDEIAKYFTDAFDASQSDYELKVTNTAVSVWSDVYYKKMMVGQFDLAFGSISGNTLNPLNFMEVLRSDNTSGFTLNWGTDTSVLSDDLEYDGFKWSFNALWQAADTGVILDDGMIADAVTYVLPASKKKNDDGTYTFTVEISLLKDADITLDTVYVSDGYAFDFVPSAVTGNAASEFDYTGESSPTAEDVNAYYEGIIGVNLGYTDLSYTMDVSKEDLKYTISITLSADLYSHLKDVMEAVEFDIYYTLTINGVSTSSTIYATFSDF